MNFNYLADFEYMLELRKEEESESFDIKQIKIEQNPYDIFQCQKNIEDFKQEKDEKESKLEFQKVNSKQKSLFEEEEDGNDKCNSITKVKKPISLKNKAIKTSSLKNQQKSSLKELLGKKRIRKL